jgi:hypothetical protein
MQLPFKTRIVKYAIDHPEPIDADRVARDLKVEYLEKQCNSKNVYSIMLTLVGIGILKIKENYFNENGELITEFIITEHGKTFSKYVGNDE